MTSIRFFLARAASILAALLFTATGFAADPPSVKTLDALLKTYRTYELPEPPADAPLVSYRTGWTIDEKGKHEHRDIGFQLKPAKVGDPIKVFRGTGEIRELERGVLTKPVKPEPEALKDVESGVDELLAVHCHARGWTELALKVLEHDLSATEESPETELAQAAWNHWLAEFRKPATDRSKVARLLKAIWEHRKDDFTVHHRNLLDALELSLVPSKAKPGSVDAMIDELIDVTETDQTDALIQIHDPHPAYMKVARLGFEAVPSLIEHLDDIRLTRAFKHGFNNFRGYNYTVSDVVCDLLQGLAGKDLGKSWLRRQQGYRLDKEAVEKWWAEAKAEGEEAYFVRKALDNERGEKWLNALMVNVLAHKYPKQLPGVYRRMVDERPEMYGDELAKSVADSILPKGTKKDLFVYAARCKVARTSMDAILHLWELDPREGSKALLAALPAFPEFPKKPVSLEGWNTRPIAKLVIDRNDAQDWAELATTAEHCPVELQLKIIGAMNYPSRSDHARTERLQFLARFFDDGALRESAATVSAELLGLRKPNSKWTRKDWDDLIEDIRITLAREGIR